MQKIFFLFLSLMMMAMVGFAQKPKRPVIDSARTNASFRYEAFIPGNYTYLDVDVLDNIYLITAGNQLKKINARFDSVAAFNDVKKYGNPSMIDVSNPLKVLVYYKNFSTVLALDRLLTLRNTINFRKANIFTVKTLSTSYDNFVWIFDEQDFKLKKIDDEGKVLQETSDWRQLFDPVPLPASIIDRDNFVYLYDESKGFYIFDYYGSFKNKLPFLNWQHVAVSGNKLYGFVKDTLYSYELNSLNLKHYPIPPFFRDYADIKTVNGKVYLLKKDGIEIYSVE
ncbi:MAG: hypothetical protein EOO20_23965 [Chryseobacterium sp.]|nr:MAG: hypothetical protein EOO20_23965 [Chryseobacterium sp.]